MWQRSGQQEVDCSMLLGSYRGKWTQLASDLTKGGRIPPANICGLA